MLAQRLTTVMLVLLAIAVPLSARTLGARPSLKQPALPCVGLAAAPHASSSWATPTRRVKLGCGGVLSDPHRKA